MKAKRYKKQTVHRRIAQLREAKELSQDQLAKLVGVDKSSISQWERGRSAPKGSRLPKVASALGVTIDDLYTESAA